MKKYDVEACVNLESGRRKYLFKGLVYPETVEDGDFIKIGGRLNVEIDFVSIDGEKRFIRTREILDRESASVLEEIWRKEDLKSGGLSLSR